MFADNQDDAPAADVNETGTAVVTDSIYGAKLESEVSISLAPFPVSSPEIDIDETPSETEVELRVREIARNLALNSVETAAKKLVDPGRFDFNLALQPDLERYAVRITPENVSFVSKKDEDIRYAGMSLICSVDDGFQGSQEANAQRVETLRDPGVAPIHGTEELKQVVRADGDEVDIGHQFVQLEQQ